jgi:hypothetical protein
MRFCAGLVVFDVCFYFFEQVSRHPQKAHMLWTEADDLDEADRHTRDKESANILPFAEVCAHVAWCVRRYCALRMLFTFADETDDRSNETGCERP